MSDHIDRAAKVIADFNACGHCEGTCGTCRGEAEAFDSAGLLASPTHDAAVAARAWNEGFTAALMQVQYGMGRQRNPYEREGGASDADA